MKTIDSMLRFLAEKIKKLTDEKVCFDTKYLKSRNPIKAGDVWTAPDDGICVWYFSNVQTSIDLYDQKLDSNSKNIAGESGSGMITFATPVLKGHRYYFTGGKSSTRMVPNFYALKKSGGGNS